MNLEINPAWALCKGYEMQTDGTFFKILDVPDWTPLLPVMPGQYIFIVESDDESGEVTVDELVSLDGKGWTNVF